MDAIDKIFFEPDFEVVIEIVDNPAARVVRVEFASLPSLETLEPINRLLSAPGFWNSGDSNVETYYRIEVPKIHSPRRVGIALAEVYKSMGKRASISEWVEPNKLISINI